MYTYVHTHKFNDTIRIFTQLQYKDDTVVDFNIVCNLKLPQPKSSL